MAATQRLAGQARQGQSLTELALVMPLVLFLVLIGANMGLALRSQTALTQLTQQAAQRLMHHPSDATKEWIANYMNSLGSDTVSPDEISVQFQAAGQDPATGRPTTQQVVIRLAHPFPVVAPVADTMNWGPLHSGSLRLYTTSSTVLATQAPSNLSVAAGAGSGCILGTWQAGATYTVSWSRPLEADGSAMPPTVPLIYQLYATPPGFPAYLIYTSPPSTSTATCFVDQDSATGTKYQLQVVEPNGLSSPPSAAVTAS